MTTHPPYRPASMARQETTSTTTISGRWYAANIPVPSGPKCGSLYQYFPNKDAILVVLAQVHLEQTAEAIRASLSRPRPVREWLPELTSAVARLHQVLFEGAPRLRPAWCWPPSSR